MITILRLSAALTMAMLAGCGGGGSGDSGGGGDTLDPDLKVEPEYMGASIAIPEQVNTATFNITNTGEGPSPATEAEVQISTFNLNRTETRSIPSLQPGQRHTVTVDATPPVDATGSQLTITLRVNRNGSAFSEPNLHDNSADFTLLVSGFDFPDRPDLELTATKVPLNYITDVPTTVRVTTKNVDSIVSAPATTISCTILDLIDSSGVLFTETQDVPELAPGAVHESTFQVTIRETGSISLGYLDIWVNESGAETGEDQFLNNRITEVVSLMEEEAELTNN